MGRYVEIEAGDCDLHEVLKPSAPYVKKKRKKKLQGPEATYGEPPPGSGGRWCKDIEQYPIPAGFRGGLSDGVVEGGLENGLMLEGYRAFFDSLLWAEECQQLIDIREFDIEGTVLSIESPKLLALQVPGLSESRPSVLRGDKVSVMVSGRKHVGFAHTVERDRVLLSFAKSFHSSYIRGMKVDIEFSFPRTMLRLQHDGLQHAILANSQLLFPDPRIQLQPARDITFKYHNELLNTEQQVCAPLAIVTAVLH